MGPVEYKAPAGIIKGYVSLKRQFKIIKGKMDYFFDSNFNILDEMLMVALSKNMTSKMKNIVETIQTPQQLASLCFLWESLEKLKCKNTK